MVLPTETWRAALVIAALTLSGACGGHEPRAPRVRAVLPPCAPAGARVAVLGERFAGENVFTTFAGFPGFVSRHRSDRLSVTVPELPPGAVHLVVTVDGRPSSPVPFEVLAEPR